MAAKDYVKIIIGDNEIVGAKEDIGVSVNYSLESTEDFQQKESGTAIDIQVPALLDNQALSNTFHNFSVEDLTSNKFFTDFQKASITVASNELLTGKAILKKATYNDKPISYTWNFFGDNADWAIDAQEMTLYDVIKHVSITYDDATIQQSWLYDGTDENLPYVFAPVKYRGFMDSVANNNNNVLPNYLRPSLSKYFIIYWGLKKLGYRIESGFFNTNYYRRMVAPWTWCNFLDSEGTKINVHKFLAKSDQGAILVDQGNGASTSINWNLFVYNDSVNGGFDNNNDYTSTSSVMEWQYKPPHFGLLDASFSIRLFVNAKARGNLSNSSDVELRVQWRKNGGLFDGGFGAFNSNGNSIVEISGNLSATDDIGIKDVFCNIYSLSPNDIVTAEFYLHIFTTTNLTAIGRIEAEVLEYKADYFKIPLGGIVSFDNLLGLKKYKWLDFLRGEIDLFNLSLKTDSITKKVTIEPTHEYSASGNFAIKQNGFFNGTFNDWTGKKDLSKEWENELYSDSERELELSFKDDTADGILKLIQDRNNVTIGKCTYLLPNRFKAGKKTYENRFYSPIIHHVMKQFVSLGTGSNLGVAPQVVALIPENISNTSNGESDNTFGAKSCYYKGLVSDAGAWKYDNNVLQTYPFMFAVNYQQGGQNDPILNYNDESIGLAGSQVIGYGLLRRFFLQRFANMRVGKNITKANIFLNNYDVINTIHRDYKIIDNNKYECVQISNYKASVYESTECFLRKTEPSTLVDSNAILPTADAILSTSTSNNNDKRYIRALALDNDII